MIRARAAGPVSAARRSFFAEHGWLVIRGGVDVARLAAARAAGDELMAPRMSGAADVVLWQLPGDARVRPVVLDLLVRSGVAALDRGAAGR